MNTVGSHSGVLVGETDMILQREEEGPYQERLRRTTQRGREEGGVLGSDGPVG